MPELPLYSIESAPHPSPLPQGERGKSGGLRLEEAGKAAAISFPSLDGRGKGRVNVSHAIDRQARKVKPLCARPAPGAFARPRPYHTGLTGGAVRSGRANVQANNYWSSTTYAANTTNAWNVNMNDGNVNNDNKTNNNYVWPVRSGEWLPRNGATPHLNPLPVRGDDVKAPSPLRGEGRGEGDADLFSFENLYRQYLKCRRNKRGTINALRFEVNAEENLFQLAEELQAKTYQPARLSALLWKDRR